MAALIGAIIGWLLFGSIHWLLSPVGLILGGLAAYSFSHGLISVQKPLSAEEKKKVELTFFQTLFPIMGQIAKADGRICEQEIKTTQQLFEKMGLDTETRKEAIDLFKSGAEPDFDLDICLEEFLQQAAINQDLRKIFVVYLVSLAFADGYLHEAEDRILKTVSKRLGFSVFAYQQILGMVEAQRYFYQGQYQRQSGYHYRDQEDSWKQTSQDDLNLAYKALGLAETATDKEIKTAWRKLMSEYHPDKLAGRGVPEDMIKLATERSQEVQAAYDLVKKYRKNQAQKSS